MERVSSGHVLLVLSRDDIVFELATLDAHSETAATAIAGAFTLVARHALPTPCRWMSVGHATGFERVYFSHVGTPPPSSRTF